MIINIRVLPYYLFVVWLLSCTKIYAQGDTVISKEIDRVDVYANSVSNQHTASVRMMKSEEISKLGLESISDAIRLFNGTNVKNYGGIGGLTTVSVRSLGAAHTTVVYDGVPVSNTQSVPIDVSKFDVGDVSEIKLAIGGDDEMLKPAIMFASAAVLSINSNYNLTDTSSKSLSAILRVGSFGYKYANISAATKLRQHSILSASAETMYADGVYPFTLVNFKTQTREKRENSDIRSYKAEIDYRLNDSLKNDLKFKAYIYSSERGLPGNVIYYKKTAYERLKDDNFFLQTEYKRRFSSAVIVKALAKYNYSFNRYNDKNVMYVNGILEQNSAQNEFLLSVMAAYQILSNVMISTAIDAKNNTLNTDITDNPSPNRNSIYAALALKINIWNFAVLNLSAVENCIRETVSHGTHLQNINRITPMVSLKLIPLSNYGVDFRLMWRNSIRIPTFNELYYTTLGYSGLVPEKAEEFNLGVDYNHKNFGISCDFFKNRVEDKIVAIPTTYVWKMSNYGLVDITGLDVSTTGNFKIHSIVIKPAIGYSYQRAKDITGDNPNLYGSQIPYTPRHSGNSTLIIGSKFFDIGYRAIWSGMRYFLENNIEDNEIKSYIEHSVSVSKTVFNSLELKFSCINIGNTQYEIIKYYPMPGIHWQLQLKYTFNK